jgi:membrane-bound lytic murein transglycosylase D
VPSTVFAYASRDRIFYRVIVGDTPHAIADAFGVTVDELRSWNAIEPAARLQEGMTLQVFVTKGADLSKVVFSKEGDVHIVAVGSDEFYAIEEAQKGNKRVTVYAAGGETLEQLGKKYGVKPASMEKINRRPRTDVLAKGEAVIVYVPAKNAPADKPASPAPTAIAVDDQPAVPSPSTTPTDDPDDAPATPESEKKPE